MIRFLWPWPDFQGHYIIKTSKMSFVKSLCAHYLFNQWMEFDQTSTDTSSGYGKEVIRFRWPWPYIINNKWVLCALHLMNHWGNGTKLADILLDQISTDTSEGWGKELIGFWWPWPYFQGHYTINTQKVSIVCSLFHESIDGIWPNYCRYIIYY